MKQLAVRFFSVVAVAVATASCGGSSSPTTPTPTATPTRIIAVIGDLAFGTVNIGSSSTKTFTITNSGNSTLTFTGMTAVGGTGVTGFAASPVSGTIAAGASQSVTLQFTPLLAQGYSNVLTVASDKTDGNNAINVSGTGFNPNPIYSRSGTGDNVFDLPSYVSRVRIRGTYTGFTSNFVVKIATRLIVNELLGTGWSQTAFDGTYLLQNPGGTVEITNSSGVAWTISEVR